MELVVNLAAPYVRILGDGTSVLQPREILVGQMDSHVRIAPTGRSRLVGIRFHPGGAYPFFRFPLFEITNRILDLAEVAPSLASNLKDRLPGCDSLEDKRRALEEIFIARLPAEPQPSAVEAAVFLALRTDGRISVDDLASATGVGSRQLERSFKAKVGLPPKLLCRILRFQSVFRSAARQDARAWAEVALECGYFDQAHFIKEFKSFSGESPVAFFRRENPLTELFTRKSRKSGSYKTPPAEDGIL